MPKIYTKVGDSGETLFKSRKISKNSSEIHVVGDLDELSCHLGLILTTFDSLPMEISYQLEKVQVELLEIGA